MSVRRASLLTSLMLTAVLLVVLPGLISGLVLRDTNRMDERLRPARTRTLTVWLLGDDVGDRKLLSQLLSAFEEEHEGVRVFLRRVSAQELTAKEAVLPDAVLYTIGDVANPEQLFVPLAGTEAAGSSGMSGGVRYGVQLWFAPNVLSFPAEWTQPEDAPLLTPKPSSFFDLGTPAPTQGQQEAQGVVAVGELPWQRLLEKGALALPQGVGLCQLLYACPTQLRTELVAAAMADEAGSAPSAAVQTLAMHNAQVSAGSPLAACALPPAVCDRVRYVSLCKQSDDAAAFVSFLLSNSAQTAALGHDLLPAKMTAVTAAQPMAALAALYEGGLVFPNAYAHTKQELAALLLDAFTRAADPVETLLRLR